MYLFSGTGEHAHYGHIVWDQSKVIIIMQGVLRF